MTRTVAVIAFLMLVGCGRSADWTGFVYPEANDLGVSVEIGRFETFEQCRTAANQTLATFGSQDIGTFECGRNCRPSETGLQVCAETRD